MNEPELPEKYKNCTLRMMQEYKATGIITEDEYYNYYHHWLKTPRFANWPKCKCKYCKSKREDKTI